MVERKKDELMQAADDVATLYSWANLHGAKYRDFSASRQEQRAQSRHRMLAEQDALAQEAVVKTAQENAKPAIEAAAAEPVTQNTQKMSSTARTDLRPEMRPIGESIHSQPRATVQYERMPAVVAEPKLPAAPVAAAAVAPAPSQPETERNPRSTAPVDAALREQQLRDQQYREERYREDQFRQEQMRDQTLRDQQFFEQQMREQQYREQQYKDQQLREQQLRDQQIRDQQLRDQQMREQQGRSQFESSYAYQQYSPMQDPRYRVSPPFDRRDPNRGSEFAPAVERRVTSDPAYNVQPRGWANDTDAMYAGMGGETLQQSRERVASRWFALKGVFEQSADPVENQMARAKDVRVPAIAVFSLAGGVGKTSLVATLGRSLASLGERVLLADTSSYGLLPYYFGARDLRPGVVRTFNPPGGSDAPISLLNVDTEQHESDPADMEWLAEELQRNARGSNRILIDLATASASLTRRALRTSPVVVVPIIPDMNSIVTLSVVDGFFRNHPNAEGRAVQPYYLLNQFDPSLPLHLDVREVLRQQMGDRLLPFVLRRSQAISEALAEGMTVVDYAPSSMVTDDFLHLANWLRSVSAPASLGYRGMRWSER